MGQWDDKKKKEGADDIVYTSAGNTWGRISRIKFLLEVQVRDYHLFQLSCNHYWQKNRLYTDKMTPWSSP
jgi:hypothetical protein